MRRTNYESMVSVGRHRSVQIFAGFLFLYLLLMSMEIPFVLKDGFGFVGSGELQHGLINNDKEMAGEERDYRVSQKSIRRNPERRMREFEQVSGLVFDEMSPTNSSMENESSQLHKLAREAFRVGKKLWEEISSGKVRIELENKAENLSDSCTHSVVMNGDKFREMGNVVVIPCGLALGSHITVVGKPNFAHPENEPNIALVREDESLMVSQFKVELQGLKTVDGEDPPRILHFNPRLKGDFSGRPVIEQNTCYRMQWGSGLRCEGWRSKADEETVDGQVKCEKWIRDDDVRSEESQTTWWVKRLIGKTSKVTIDWPYPFVEDKLFVLTLSAGLEGFHVNVDGRHVTSFPYRIGFTLEDATGLSISGDVDVHSVFAASLPTSHPSFGPQKLLEMSTQWQASPLPHGPVELFIGILSAGNHFAERMAVRKSWMQHPFIKSSNVVVRFFVALHGRNEVNVQLMKEAEFFGDIVTVPYMDHYDLVVLKTIAICEYGVRKLAAKYIMKCDDDTFVRVEAVMWEVKKVHDGPLYVGNINYYHKPLRYGKWAVTYEEWPEEVYPPYANGPGYILSSDIAQYILTEFENHNLRLFKMEDVSMGVWVEQFNNRTRGAGVEYVHSLNFCQFGCIQDYYTAHYQSPRQMMCLWETLQRTRKPTCCDMR